MLTVKQMQERAVKAKTEFVQKIPEAASWIDKVEIFFISQRQRMNQRAAAFEKI